MIKKLTVEGSNLAHNMIIHGLFNVVTNNRTSMVSLAFGAGVRERCSLVFIHKVILFKTGIGILKKQQEQE